MHKYVGFIYEEPDSLLDYLPRNGLLIMDEMSRIQDTATSLDHEEAEWYSSLLMTNRMVKGGSFSFDWTTVWDKIDHQRLYMSIFLRHIDRKSTRLNSSHVAISYAVFCLKKKIKHS